MSWHNIFTKPSHRRFFYHEISSTKRLELKRFWNFVQYNLFRFVYSDCRFLELSLRCLTKAQRPRFTQVANMAPSWMFVQPCLISQLGQHWSTLPSSITMFFLKQHRLYDETYFLEIRLIKTSHKNMLLLIGRTFHCSAPFTRQLQANQTSKILVLVCMDAKCAATCVTANKAPLY